jgi:hypothetical protein
MLLSRYSKISHPSLSENVQWAAKALGKGGLQVLKVPIKVTPSFWYNYGTLQVTGRSRDLDVTAAFFSID